MENGIFFEPDDDQGILGSDLNKYKGRSCDPFKGIKIATKSELPIASSTHQYKEKNILRIPEFLTVYKEDEGLTKIKTADDVQLLYENKPKAALNKIPGSTKKDFIESELIHIKQLLDVPGNTTTALGDTRPFIVIYKRILEEELKIINQAGSSSNKRYTHRVHIFANQYKSIVGLEDKKLAREWKKKGARWKNLFYTTQKASKRYAPETQDELEQLIEFLSDSQEARKIAINNLDKIKNS